MKKRKRGVVERDVTVSPPEEAGGEARTFEAVEIPRGSEERLFQARGAVVVTEKVPPRDPAGDEDLLREEFKSGHDIILAVCNQLADLHIAWVIARAGTVALLWHGSP